MDHRDAAVITPGRETRIVISVIKSAILSRLATVNQQSCGRRSISFKEKGDLSQAACHQWAREVERHVAPRKQARRCLVLNTSPGGAVEKMVLPKKLKSRYDFYRETSESKPRPA